MSGYLNYLEEKYETQNIKAINERLVELSSLFEISQILNASLELNTVLNNILLIPMGRMMISKGAVILRHGKSYELRLWKGLSPDSPDLEFNSSDLPVEIFVPSDDSPGEPAFEKFSTFMKSHNLAIAVPLNSQDQLVGMVLYGNKLAAKPFNSDETDFLSSLANLSATSVENALKVDEIRGINLQLDERIQQLKTLFDIAQGLSATLDSEKIIKLLTYALMGQMLVYHYAIVIYGNQNLRKVDCKGFLKDAIEDLAEHPARFADITDTGRVGDLNSPKIQAQLKKLGAQVFIPLRHQNRSLGFILMGEKINKQDYTGADLEFLTTLVSQAVISLENARLFKETLEKQRIEQELQVAKTIQKKLLPHEIAQIEGYDAWGLNISSKEVGGDYFDIIPISNGRFVITIGDVSGKSVPAALLMANLQAGLRIIIDSDMPLDKVAGRLNDLIYQNTDMDKYITFFVGILDIRTHEFSYVNAGHNPPLIINGAGEIKLLDIGGIILGMMPDYPYQMGKVKFQPNDLLVCYTDGVSEAMNPQEEELGEERLYDFIRDKRAFKAKDLSEQLVAYLTEYAAGAPQADDITLVVARRM